MTSCMSKSIKHINELCDKTQELHQQATSVKNRIYVLQKDINTIRIEGKCDVELISKLDNDLNVIRLEVEQLENGIYVVYNDGTRVKMLVEGEIKDYRRKLSKMRIINLLLFIALVGVSFRAVKKLIDFNN